jgi:RNA recognition motif-containing protein
VVKDPHLNECRGFAFVRFLTNEEAMAAIRGEHDQEFHGRRMIVELVPIQHFIIPHRPTKLHLRHQYICLAYVLFILQNTYLLLVNTWICLHDAINEEFAEHKFKNIGNFFNAQCSAS